MTCVTILRKALLVGLFFLLALSQAPLMSQAHLASAVAGVWTSLGPEGGTIETLAIDPSDSKTLYAGTFAYGVFKSTDGGAHWSAANAMGNIEISALAIDPVTPTTLYAGSRWSSHGVFKSTDCSSSCATKGLSEKP